MEKQLKQQSLCVIGLGLIGGSLAYECKENSIVHHVIGVDNNLNHTEKALSLGLVDQVLTFTDAIAQSDMIALAIPVSDIIQILPKVLDLMKSHQVVFDLGSTKESIIQAVSMHENSSRFIPAHPMAGTEFSGPNAAMLNLFADQACIICDSPKQNLSARNRVEELFEALRMKVISMSAKEHDMHVAYVSHIAHITSFVLASTVLEKEKSTKTIFDLASGGFRSTVRLAKSPSSMWLPIFKENKENVLEVLDTYLEEMKAFKEMIENDDDNGLIKKMEQGNQIKKILG